MHDSVAEWWNAISLRTKITGVTVLVLTAGLLIAGVGTVAMLKPALIQQADAQLKLTASGNLTGLLVATEVDGKDTYTLADGTYFVAVYNSAQQLVDHNWKAQSTASLPAISGTLSPADLPTVDTDAPRTILSDDGSTEYHSYVVPIQDTSGDFAYVLFATSMRPIDNTVAMYLSIFFGMGLGVIILGALLTRFLVTNTFHPLREVENTAAAIAEGDFSQRLAVVTPNTEVGRLNRSLNMMLNRIDRAFTDRARTIEQMRRFVGDASHELRTPLVTVRGYAELYRMGALPNTDDVAQAMVRIEKEAIRMGGLVEDLLELARLDEKTRPAVLGPVDLAPVARDAALDAKAASPGRIVTVVVDHPPLHEKPSAEEEPVNPTTDPTMTKPARGDDHTATGPIAFAGATLARLRSRRPRKPGESTGPVPEIAPKLDSLVATEVPAVVLGEENKLRQVVTNLIGNALRFTPADSPLEIGVSASATTKKVTIAIIDHGDGVPPQIRDKIFQRFWRADTSRARETGGSGLGLAIVSSIVAGHSGTVGVSETPGGGATFRVELPLLEGYNPASVTPRSGEKQVPARA